MFIFVMASKVMTSAKEAEGPKNLKQIFFVFFHKKRTDLLLIFVENTKKSKINSPYWGGAGGTVFLFLRSAKEKGKLLLNNTDHYVYQFMDSLNC
jgi:hypothetical protein